jgi:AcrR family transcriptional regulator
VDSPPPASARRRRHGAQLQSDLLDAAWKELVETGYGRLTMGSVAARAGTSEHVLYRRWANKDQLVYAALEHYGDTHPVATPDTGTLRGDLLAHLKSVSETMAGFYPIAMAAALSGMLTALDLTPAEAREQTMTTRGLPLVRTIYRRAHDRGEINVERIPPAVLAMPFDLVRHDMLMDLKPLKPERIQTIVDELFLPLVAVHHGGPERQNEARWQ